MLTYSTSYHFTNELTKSRHIQASFSSFCSFHMRFNAQRNEGTQMSSIGGNLMFALFISLSMTLIVQFKFNDQIPKRLKKKKCLKVFEIYSKKYSFRPMQYFAYICYYCIKFPNFRFGFA